MNIRWPQPFLAIAMMALSGFYGKALGVTIAFEDGIYKTTPGAAIDIVTYLSEPVPNGLEAYALKLEFPGGVLNMSIEDIIIPPELDFGLVDPGAQRDLGTEFASVAGYVELGQPAYTGRDFIHFSITVSPFVAPGLYTLSLVPLLESGVNFVDGQGDPLDETIVFGTMTLEVVESRPEESLDFVVIEILSGDVRLAFPGLEGWRYAIYATENPDLGWSLLGHVKGFPGGFLTYFFDPSGPSEKRRFYQVRPDD